MVVNTLYNIQKEQNLRDELFPLGAGSETPWHLICYTRNAMFMQIPRLNSYAFELKEILHSRHGYSALNLFNFNKVETAN
jgi:hypothetical protein